MNQDLVSKGMLVEEVRVLFNRIARDMPLRVLYQSGDLTRSSECLHYMDFLRYLLQTIVRYPANKVTPIDDRKGYIDLGGYRILVEDGELVGVYPHGGLEDDPVLGVEG